MPTTHTPGPWRVTHDSDDCLSIVADQGKKWDNPTICHPYEDVTPEDSVTCAPWLKAFDNYEANARLICAAPALLDALSRIVHEFDLGRTPIARDLSQARAALALATTGD